MKKQISILLIASQISMALASTGAFAATSTAPTAEASMLANILAMKGAKLSDKDAAAQVNTIVTQYAAAAPAEGREQRLETALVDLNVFTPDQASKFVAQAQDAGSAVDAASPTQAQDVMAKEINQLAQMNPKAAQFSTGACYGVVAAEAVGFFGGIFTIIEGNWTRQYNPTCSSQIDGPANVYVPGAGTVSGTLVSTTCTNPSDHPHNGEGIGLIFSGIAILAGTVALIALSGCEN